ncbi:hypothetical protein B0H13DRAFT_2538656 [Mycena leptocephala]|nr:hypothetical protein B0H13DRAFT_2538656 [Mycena leptocephala]
MEGLGVEVGAPSSFHCQLRRRGSSAPGPAKRGHYPSTHPPSPPSGSSGSSASAGIASGSRIDQRRGGLKPTSVSKPRPLRSTCPSVSETGNLKKKKEQIEIWERKIGRPAVQTIFRRQRQDESENDPRPVYPIVLAPSSRRSTHRGEISCAQDRPRESRAGPRAHDRNMNDRASLPVNERAEEYTRPQRKKKRNQALPTGAKESAKTSGGVGQMKIKYGLWQEQA